MAKKAAIINVETHFLKYGNHIYAESLMDRFFWGKYLKVFDDLYVLVRMKKYEGEDLNKWIISDCENVHFLPLPDYRGPRGYLRQYINIRKCMRKYININPDITCAIIRSPSPLGYLFLNFWKKTGKPYGLEIVANLSDDYYYSIDFIHSILYGRLHTMTKRYARSAKGVAYVTRQVLQKQYPAKGTQENYSSIDLPKELFYKRSPLVKKKDEYVMIHVSTLALDVKGNEQFLQVQKRLREEGYDVTSVIVGGGQYMKHYINRAEKLGLEPFTRFTGHISEKEKLMEELRQADIFLFPTLSEGLPRTVIEAMACSLPCISSDIPSIRELLDEKWLCQPQDVDGFVKKIKTLMTDVSLYNKTADRNYNIAKEYEYSVLNERRSKFYKKLCE